jgi:hypothetical protein
LAEKTLNLKGNYCFICYEDLSKSELTDTLICGHKFCKDDWKAYLSTAVTFYN